MFRSGTDRRRAPPPRYHLRMNLTLLIDTATLAAHLGDPGWIVFDCRHDLADPGAGENEYALGHIPGARFLHLDRDLSGLKNGSNGRHPLPDPEKFAGTLARAGVGPQTQVVAYDAQGGMNAARLWWLLRWTGHGHAAVLDGGWKAWTAESRPQTVLIPVAAPAQLRPVLRPIALSAPEVRAALGRQPLLDARTAERYRGRSETLDPVGGRIPGAMNRFFMHNLDDSGRFKSAGALRRELGAVLGDTSPSEVVHYCGSGVSACHNILAMEIAGLSGSRLYPGSWSEWCADPSRPTAQDEPQPDEAIRP